MKIYFTRGWGKKMALDYKRITSQINDINKVFSEIDKTYSELIETYSEIGEFTGNAIGSIAGSIVSSKLDLSKKDSKDVSDLASQGASWLGKKIGGFIGNKQKQKKVKEAQIKLIDVTKGIAKTYKTTVLELTDTLNFFVSASDELRLPSLMKELKFDDNINFTSVSENFNIAFMFEYNLLKCEFIKSFFDFVESKTAYDNCDKVSKYTDGFIKNSYYFEKDTMNKIINKIYDNNLNKNKFLIIDAFCINDKSLFISQNPASKKIKKLIKDKFCADRKKEILNIPMVIAESDLYKKLYNDIYCEYAFHVGKRRGIYILFDSFFCPMIITFIFLLLRNIVPVELYIVYLSTMLLFVPIFLYNIVKYKKNPNEIIKDFKFSKIFDSQKEKTDLLNKKINIDMEQEIDKIQSLQVNQLSINQNDTINSNEDDLNWDDLANITDKRNEANAENKTNQSNNDFDLSKLADEVDSKNCGEK